MTPVDDPAAATPGVPELHVPPDAPSPRVVVAPAQADKVPVIAVGNALTVATIVVKQPEDVV